ncbi:hypothetical protein MASSI9I_60299 [Massilia sp. 9I]|nr:hypothetical protein MASSI9I_60299 [Massilia sp. 9I]
MIAFLYDMQISKYFPNVIIFCGKLNRNLKIFFHSFDLCKKTDIGFHGVETSHAYTDPPDRDGAGRRHPPAGVLPLRHTRQWQEGLYSGCIARRRSAGDAGGAVPAPRTGTARRRGTHPGRDRAGAHRESDRPVAGGARHTVRPFRPRHRGQLQPRLPARRR